MGTPAEASAAAAAAAATAALRALPGGESLDEPVLEYLAGMARRRGRTPGRSVLSHARS
jgi:hypothetical protein